MSVTNKSRGPSDLMPIVVVAGLGTLIVAVLGTWGAMLGGAAIANQPKPAGNPVAAVINLVAGKQRWPGTAATVIVVAELAVVVLLVVLVWAAVRRTGNPRVRVDAAARHLANRNEQAMLSREGVAATAARLGAPQTHPGVRVGRARGTGQPLYGSWEDEQIDIWGPRTGKTTSRAIPAILDAPGSVLVTSNKRDIVDATRLIREGFGEVWVFDPQKVVGEEPTWWWNPLSYVTDIEKATRLASIFVAYGKDADAKTDAYFDPEGESLLSFLLLAAAEANEPITTVFSWAADPTETKPVEILRAAGHHLPADGVQGVINSPDKQRAGIYGTCKKSVNFLVNPSVTRWVTPDPRNSHRLRFDPHAFAAGRGTLYSLSREGQGTAGPLVTALTVATIEAAEELATRSPGGRLTLPLLGVLDEAANVCRWKDLPDLYSHYGSRGIVLMTILQSWAQGVVVWGENGMKKLWSAANIRVYGGGVSETQFLSDLSQLLGDFEPETTSVSTSRGEGRSHSTQVSTRVEKILEVSDLAALPRGRAVLFASGTRPVLIETEPWQHGPHAAQVRASLARYAPPEQADAHRLTGGPGGGA
ncbi:type IV secretory system conjugative DNA transfer family protein [Streptantibioticus ferralitis]|uniref:TraM recognition domain-containing protein n=1 Tax=Streptantibioticus ferralitis TaxID=236510 RepID=A0ABT5Z6Q2_9ACTN|nr:TraM recognition domain-containing protein [Streptantibioticus ferralitis]MDF2259489.1 TraM recognition domain-containing protein [Streptantibioticus ferralitis]